MIPMDAYQKTLWVEVCAQMLTGRPTSCSSAAIQTLTLARMVALFTITGIGLFPSRLQDTYWIIVIARYSRALRLRKAKRQGDSPADLSVSKHSTEIDDEDGLLSPAQSARYQNALVSSENVFRFL